MGWFMENLAEVNPVLIFVPAWGWIGSEHDYKSLKSCDNIFVPAWGWVGSILILKGGIAMKIFVPAWGWVGSQWVHGARTTKKFSSPLGVGLVPKNNFQRSKKQ